MEEKFYGGNGCNGGSYGNGVNGGNCGSGGSYGNCDCSAENAVGGVVVSGIENSFGNDGNGCNGEEKRFPVVKILLKRIWFIICAVVIGAAAGLCYALFARGTVYTAKTDVILITQILYPSESGEYISVRDNLNFARVYLPTLATNVVSPVYVNEANRIYNEAAGKTDEKSVSGSAIKVDYGEESLIFSVSYTDKDEKAAAEKLDALIESMRRNTVNFMGASKSEIRKVQDEATVTADDGVLKFSLIGLAAGLVLGVGAAFLLYFADNTVKDADELKAITGAELLAKVDTKN